METVEHIKTLRIKVISMGAAEAGKVELAVIGKCCRNRRLCAELPDQTILREAVRL